MFTIEYVEGVIKGLALHVSWPLAIYSDAKVGCNMAGAQCSHILMIAPL